MKDQEARSDIRELQVAFQEAVGYPVWRAVQVDVSLLEKINALADYLGVIFIEPPQKVVVTKGTKLK